MIHQAKAILKSNPRVEMAYQFLKPSPDPEVRIFSRYLDSEDIVLDSGACKGASSIHYAKIAKQVYALEPNPEMFFRLRLNTFFNPKIKPKRAGLWSESGEMHLFKSKEDKLGKASSVFSSKITSEFDSMIDNCFYAYSIDDLQVPFTALCLDLEGAEGHALLGAKKVLSSSVKKVMMETHLIKGQGTFDKCLKILEGFDFRLEYFSEIDSYAHQHGIESYATFCKPPS
jgi:FkbM family methyltransferase